MEGNLEEAHMYNEALELNRKLKEMMLMEQEMGQNMGAGAIGERDQRGFEQQRQPQSGGVRKSKKKNVSSQPPRNNYTFTSSQIKDMRYGNQNLVGRLQKIASRDPSVNTWGDAKGPAVKRNSSHINRAKKDMEVARQNRAFAKRLENVKPSINRSRMEKDHVRNRQIARNIRAVKPPKALSRPEWE